MNLKEIEQTIFKLCVQANTVLPKDVFSKVFDAYQKTDEEAEKSELALILENAIYADKTQRPLCQDTGQVLIFLKIGQDVKLEGGNLVNTINTAVAKAYSEKFFRKSVVKNVFERENTFSNTPAIIYTDIVDGEDVEINVLIKGGGCENASDITMLNPTTSEDELVQHIVDIIKKNGPNSCPPLFVGIGAGATIDYAAVLSKKAFFEGESNELTAKIKTEANDLFIGAANSKGSNSVLDVKILTAATHIACMPVAVSMNCHSLRHARAIVSPNGVKYFDTRNNFDKDLIYGQNLEQNTFPKINADEIEKIKSLNVGDRILLSGEIYIARDAAHKKMIEKLPFDIKDKIIFYAGPCPEAEGEIIGPVGPTTASRMDKYAQYFYENGLLATIGKGKRGEDFKGLYFEMSGGIACLMKEKVIKKELVAYPNLGPEAVYKITVKDLPLRVNVK